LRVKSDDKYALFLGCTIPLRGRQYELAAIEVARRFDIDLAPLQDFACCGFPIKSASREANLLLAARNLAVAADEGRDIAALCSSCASVLAETAQELAEDPNLLAKVNGKLKAIGREIKEVPRVTHWAKLIYDKVGPDRFAEAVTNPLDGFRFAVHYGCHYLKPSWAFPDGEDPEAPHTISDLIRAAGAETVEYTDADRCCGGAVLAVNQDLALTIAGRKLTQMAEKGADALVVVCPFCAVMYDDNQKKAAGLLETELDIPIVYLPQVLGLALGMTPKEVGLNLQKNKPARLIEAFTEI
jgi:heterodisulfide reductase subunit B